MSTDLISKKDLLELTGISYGQLYRWKRKNLIPEDWFVRKSTFTGQETFFPKEKILERIDKIQTMKEDLSLDELANMFSPSVTEICLSKEDMLRKGIASESVIQFFIEQTNKAVEFQFVDILYLYILEELLQSGEISLEEGKMVLQVLHEHYEKMKQKNSELVVIRKLGISTCFLVSNVDDLFFEKGTKVVVRITIMNYTEALKTKLL
ncbi:YhbD family protein [Bacillus sp. DX1.1]|uniref:YhbD family protein n=1 Tax=unclassified Bacillus (in: firmicutes) TaxID=185979 RepID=UPI0025701BC2|nr:MULTISPECIES: YhbD family protein [unclassified Bacillus (in: firmicutes)]MDM5155233.1 YhbD family protein [Bacillus sp. DX1.1]WJE79553.1 YhbD family protein [Bacillus sp. DX3.1]